VLIVLGVVLCGALPASALAADNVDLKCPENGGWQMALTLMSVNFQDSIAEGRTTLDVEVTIRSKGVATFAVTAGGQVVGSAQLENPDEVDQVTDQWVEIDALPQTGDLELVTTFAPNSVFSPNATCPTLTSPIKRVRGLPLLGAWNWLNGSTIQTTATDKSRWGKWSEADTPRLIRGSCQTLSKAPIVMTVRSTGVVGKKASRLVIKDQCDLVASNTMKRDLKVLGGTIRVRSGAISFKSSLRRAGEQRYVSTMTIGQTKRRFDETATYSPSYRIWQGTDSFWNTCILDDLSVYSEGGSLYCTVGASLIMETTKYGHSAD
jgi:hypothetical protein